MGGVDIGQLLNPCDPNLAQRTCSRYLSRHVRCTVCNVGGGENEHGHHGAAQTVSPLVAPALRGRMQALLW